MGSARRGEACRRRAARYASAIAWRLGRRGEGGEGAKGETAKGPVPRGRADGPARSTEKGGSSRGASTPRTSVFYWERYQTETVRPVCASNTIG